jgi:hypothetical protein
MPRHQNTKTSERLDFPGWASPNFTPVPDELFDSVMADLSGSQLKVLLYIMRRTFGFKKERDAISFRQFREGIRRRDGTALDRGCGVKSYGQINDALQALEARGYIVSYKDTTQQGDKATTLYRLRFAGEFRPNGVLLTSEGGVLLKSEGGVLLKSEGPVLRKSEDRPPISEVRVLRKSEGQETVQQTVLQEQEATEQETQRLWQRVLVELAVQMSKPNYETWFRDTRLVSLDGELAVIAAPNPFTAEWLDTRCKPLIRKTLGGIIQRPVECQIVLAG